MDHDDVRKDFDGFGVVFLVIVVIAHHVEGGRIVKEPFGMKINGIFLHRKGYFEVVERLFKPTLLLSQFADLG